MKKKILLFACFAVALSLATLLYFYPFSHQNETKFNYGKENNDLHNVETKSISPYAQFGDSSVVLTTKQERTGIWEIENSNPNDEVQKIVFHSKSGILYFFNKKGVLIANTLLPSNSKARFLSADPMAAKRDWLTPYNYVQNNPLIRIDPTGKTDFKLNEKTGDINQVGDSNNNPDRILKTDRNGNVKLKGDGLFGFLVRDSQKGQAKVAIDNIEQGILKNGINFKTNNNVVDVGGTGQPSISGVESFALKLSNFIDKEIGGYYLASKNQSKVDHVYIGGYEKNDSQNERSRYNLYTTRPDLVNNVDVATGFHTHLFRFDDNSRLNPSKQDYEQKERQKANIGTFIIITNPKTFPY